MANSKQSLILFYSGPELAFKIRHYITVIKMSCHFRWHATRKSGNYSDRAIVGRPSRPVGSYRARNQYRYLPFRFCFPQPSGLIYPSKGGMGMTWFCHQIIVTVASCMGANYIKNNRIQKKVETSKFKKAKKSIFN
jgi:hypothetical protein